MATCPTCRGEKQVHGLVHYEARPAEFRSMPCFDCKGTGEVSDERVIWQRDARILRDGRLARDESLREMARRIGVSPVDLSAAEHGRVDPGPMIALAQRKAIERIRSRGVHGEGSE